MKFMCRWKVHEGKRRETREMFAKMDLKEYKTQQGPEIKLIGRWHDLAGGWAVFETDNQEALYLWLGLWANVCDFETTPVVEDDEAHAATRKIFAI